MSNAADRYVDLLLESVNGSVYGAASQLVPVRPGTRLKKRVASAFEHAGRPIAVRETVSPTALESGQGWPQERWNPGESMAGRARLRQLSAAVRLVLAEDIPGDIIETGVWRGGSCILAKGVLEAYDDDTRTVYVADSFQGLPAADEGDDAADLHFDPTLAVSQQDVAANFERYGLLDERVVFVKGWFSDTLPGLSDMTWSVIRLDGDMYDSTMDAITNLYPRLSPGGFLIVDDYFAYESCRRAITEYRAEHAITAEIIDIDGTGAYWRA